MIKKIVSSVKNMEKNILKIMISGFKFSFAICIIACVLSVLYIINPISHILYDSAIILFKAGLTFAVMFFVCAFAIDSIKKQMV